MEETSTRLVSEKNTYIYIWVFIYMCVYIYSLYICL